jgi:hypothetical protein
MLRMKYIFRLIFFLILLSCKKEFKDSPTEETVKFAVEIGSSEIPYIQIKTTGQILNEPKISAEMNYYIDRKSFIDLR